MSIDEAKELVLGHPRAGLFVYFRRFEDSKERRFLHLAGSGLATVSRDSMVSEREYAAGELLGYLDSESFWALEDYASEMMWDGCEYLIVFKNREGRSKVLHLSNPEFSDSAEIHKLISLVESEALDLA